MLMPLVQQEQDAQADSIVLNSHQGLRSGHGESLAPAADC